MTREILRDKLTKIFSGREHFDGEVYITEAMQLIDSWVGEVLGEDEEKEGQTGGLRFERDKLREQQRARAGLSTKGGKEPSIEG